MKAVVRLGTENSQSEGENILGGRCATHMFRSGSRGGNEDEENQGGS
jgi:hypothetical protein